MFFFNSPNNTIHHPIRAGDPVITRPHRDKKEREESEVEQGMGQSVLREGSRGGPERDCGIIMEASGGCICLGTGL